GGKCAPHARGFYRLRRREAQKKAFPSAAALRTLFQRAPQLPREREDHMLLAPAHLARALRTPVRELLDHLLNEQLGRGRAGCQADGALALEPFTAQVRRPVDEVAGDAGALGQLTQA